MNLTSIRAAILLASAAATAAVSAADFHWGPADSNWHLWSDTASWTDANGNPVAAAPGAGDSLTDRSRSETMNVDLEGATVSIANWEWSNNSTLDTIAIRNGTLSVTGKSTFGRATIDLYGATYTTVDGEFAYNWGGVGTINVHDNSTFEITGKFWPRIMNVNVDAGGTFVYGAAAIAQNCNYNNDYIISNSGLCDWPNGFQRFNGAWSFKPYFKQLAGEWRLGGNVTYQNNLFWRIELTGGKVAATANVSFNIHADDANAFARFTDGSDLELSAAAGKTLDLSNFEYAGAAKITKTGDGALLLADVPSSLDLQGGTTTFAANTRTTMDSLKVAAGQAFTFANANTTLATLEGNNGTITIAAPGLAIGSLAAGATLGGTFTAQASAFGAGDVIATIPDATLRAKVKSDLETAGLGISENGSDLVVGLPSFVFDTTTTTDLNNAAGWSCGYVPAGKDVVISGSGVEGVLSATTPAFASVTVQDGATLTLANGVTASNITLKADATLALAAGATATLSNALAALPAGPDTPAVSVPAGATLQVPGGFTFGNLSLTLRGALATTTSGDLTFGYAAPGETASFALSANGATITTSGGNINFACPAQGGTVEASGAWTLANTTFTHGNAYGFDLGRNNPATSPVQIIFDNTVLNYQNGDHYIEGGIRAVFRNGARLYRNNESAGANLYVRGGATLEFQSGTLFQYGLSQKDGSVGNGRVDFRPDTDGHVALVLDGATLDVYHFEGNSRAVAEIRGTALATQTYNAWNRSHVFKGFKAVQFSAGAGLVQSLGPDGGPNGGPAGNTIGNVVSVDQIGPFTGSGSFTFSNAIPAKTRTYNLTSPANTATGALKGAVAQNAVVAIAASASWAGTVVWDGGVTLAATVGTPFTYTFGGVRSDTPFTFRLWEGGSCDTVNLTGEGWTGSAQPIFAVQDGYDPAPGDRWVLGTIPAGTSAPALASARWRLSIEAVDGDADKVRLVLSASSVDFTFNSTTITALTNAAGWACGYVPVGEDVAIAGAGVTALLDATNVIPAFASVTVRDGAALRVTATNDLPALTLRSGASLSVEGADATAVLSSFNAIAPAEGASPAIFAVTGGATAVLPGGTGVKNVLLRLENATLENDGSGPLTLGAADDGESAVFGLSATNSTIATLGNTALLFMSPSPGGAVAPLGDLALTNCAVKTGTGAISFGVNNPTNTPFTVRFHGTDLAIAADMVSDSSSALTFSGDGTVALTGGARFYRSSPYSGQGGALNPTFEKRGRLTLEGTNADSPADFRFPFCGNGESAIVSSPDEDGFSTMELSGTRAWIWTPRPARPNNRSNGKAVWKIADTAFAFGMLTWWGQQQVPFHGLKAVEIAEGTALTLERRKLGSPWAFGDTNLGDGSDDASGSHTLRLADVPFCGNGSVVITNTYDKDFHVLVSCGANTAAGTIAAYDHPDSANAGKTKVLFNDGANWAGTVVADGHVALVKNGAASISANFTDSGEPATVAFGGVRFDGDLALRLWADGSADQVNFGSLGFSGPGGIAFAFPNGSEPKQGKWVIGTKPKSVPVPPVASRKWRISAKALDETTDQLVASPVIGLILVLQ